MTKTETQGITWDEVHQLFAPFVGTCLYAIRAEAFFHFAAYSRRPNLFRFKNIFYPAVVAWRSIVASQKMDSYMNPYFFVCDYGAEPGFGTLVPLLKSFHDPATLVVNARVLAARKRELAQLEDVRIICADSVMIQKKSQWRSLWCRSHRDLLKFEESLPQRLRPLVKMSRHVLQTLLVRAYLYENFYEEQFSEASPHAVVTHNDFTALSYLAGEVARRKGIPDFTLQHGFPSQEYFPASASHYLVWGPLFQQMMGGRALNGTRFISSGAPRLDRIAFSAEGKKAAREKLLHAQLIVPGKLNVLFLSQSHTPLFSRNEHQQILSLAGSLAQEPWIHMMVRPHPQESKTTLQSHLGFSHAAVLPSKISLADAVLACDVVISVNSTAMLEAALLDAPVLQLALPSLEERLGMLCFPRQVHDLPAALAELRSLRNSQERVEWVACQQPLVRACVHDPGHGTENTWRYIKEHSVHSATLVTPAMSH